MSSPAPAPPATPPPATHCHYCGSPLKEPGARKCTECGEWQKQRDQLLGVLLGKASLGDIALVASVLLLLWTTFSSFIFGESAHVEMRTLTCEGGAVTAALFNSGSVDGVVTSPVLYGINQSQPVLLGEMIATEGEATPAALVLAPNAGPRVVTFTLATSTHVELSRLAAGSQCEVRATKYEKDAPDGRDVNGGTCPCSALSG